MYPSYQVLPRCNHNISCLKRSKTILGAITRQYPYHPRSSTKFLSRNTLSKRSKILKRNSSKLITSNSAEQEEVTTKVKAWVHKFIIGQNVCPFAAGALRNTHFKVCSNEAPEFFEKEFAKEVEFLLEQPLDQAFTTLYIMPGEAADDYCDFMEETLTEANQVVEKMGLEGEVQVVPFHPDADFSEVDDDPAIYVARSPYPLLHLLRQVDISQAETDLSLQGKVPFDVTEENTARMHGLGNDFLKNMMSEYLHSPP